MRASYLSLSLGHLQAISVTRKGVGNFLLYFWRIAKLIPAS